jgi:hypothetical protein
MRGGAVATSGGSVVGVVSLTDLGIDGSAFGRESVSMLVGPNGSGKSSLLLEIARTCRSRRRVLIVSNTPHDRFAGLRGVRRLSAGRTDQSPRMLVKKSVVAGLDAGAEFYHISSILEHCGYRPRFGFRITPAKNYRFSVGDLLNAANFEVPKEERPGMVAREDDDDLHRAIDFVSRHDPGNPVWIDATADQLEFSLAKEFSSVLKRERLLRRWGVIGGVSVHLKRDDGFEIEIHHASSGQLALISSLLFLVTNIGERPLILIDEPENSLHPNWQREYVEKLLAAVSYRNAAILIATHAPLVVTGALADSPDVVSVFEVRDGRPRDLKLNKSQSASSIEEVLWRAFDVVTPANHFVSEQIVDAISRFEKREIEKEQVLKLVDRLDEESFDRKQKRFFGAVRELIGKVESARDSGRDYGNEEDLGVDGDA